MAPAKRGPNANNNANKGKANSSPMGGRGGGGSSGTRGKRGPARSQNEDGYLWVLDLLSMVMPSDSPSENAAVENFSNGHSRHPRVIFFVVGISNLK